MRTYRAFGVSDLFSGPPSVRMEIEEEATLIRLQGGEMPEVALFDSLETLSHDNISPTEEELRVLKAAVLDRYKDIVRRDLDPENQTRDLFRGPARARTNLKRLTLFAEKQGLPFEDFYSETAERLISYLKLEASAIAAGRAFNTLGLERRELETFLSECRARLPDEFELLEAVYSVKTLDFKEAIAARRAESTT